ncbi:hypothetical protein SVIOM74S_06761 [Streptomyces violarus]
MEQNLDRYRMSIAPYKKWLLLGITALVGLIARASASGQWRTWLMWVNGVAFGQKDPQFKLDVSFYAFDLPWYRFLLGFGFAAILSVIAAALTHYLYGGLRVTSPGAGATAAATGHLSVSIGIFVALKAVAYWLDRYGLAVKSSDFRATDNWTGLKEPTPTPTPRQDDPVLHRRHLRAAVLRHHLAAHLAAARDRLRSDGALRDPHRRPLPGDRETMRPSTRSSERRGQAPEPPDEGDTTTPPPTSDNPTVQQALEDAQKAFDAGQEALKDNDWEAYGRAQKDLEDALQRAEDAQAQAGRGGAGGGESKPSASPSPKPSGSPSPKPSS